MFPEWKLHSAFITDLLNQALTLDAKLSSHPIEIDCPDAAMINQVCYSLDMFIHPSDSHSMSQIFDSLSYAKAASGDFETVALY